MDYRPPFPVVAPDVHLAVHRLLRHLSMVDENKNESRVRFWVSKYVDIKKAQISRATNSTRPPIYLHMAPPEHHPLEHRTRFFNALNCSLESKASANKIRKGARSQIHGPPSCQRGAGRNQPEYVFAKNPAVHHLPVLFGAQWWGNMPGPHKNSHAKLVPSVYYALNHLPVRDKVWPGLLPPAHRVSNRIGQRLSHGFHRPEGHLQISIEIDRREGRKMEKRIVKNVGLRIV